MSDRVLLLIKGLARGGAEQLLASALPYVDREQFEYEIAYVLPELDALAEEMRSAGISVTCLGDGGSVWLRRLRSFLLERDFDLIHSHLPLVSIGVRLVRPTRTRLVYTEHNEWACYRGSTRTANLATFSRNDHVFAVSDHVRRSIRYPRALRGLLRMPRVETLLHGIDADAVAGWSARDGVRSELGIEAAAPVVGTVSNFRKEKALEDMVRAAAVVRRTVPDVRFVLVGAGPTESRVRALASQLGLRDTVIFAGYRPDAPRVVTSFDVFTMSSIHEGLSIALVEALALGKPAVVTDAGGLSEVVEDGVQGYVVPPRDPSALAARVVSLLCSPYDRQRLGDAARVRARQFDIRSAVRRMEDVYAELLA